MEITREKMEELRAAGSKEAFMDILKKSDMGFSAEDAENLYERLKSSPELTDDELANAVGGIAVRPPNIPEKDRGKIAY